MKNVIVAIALVFTVSAAAFADGPSNTSSNNVGQTINVKAKLTRGLSMNLVGSNATLDFGTLTLPVTAAPTITPTGQGSVELQIVGDDNSQVTLSGTSSNVSLNNGSATLTFTPNVWGSMTTSGASALNSKSVTLGSDGNYYLFVGGNLPSSILTTQATGQYSGQFQITVAYTND
ncbi:MAG: DUF4402 domain-containing protein [Bacteroidetes bacterium]|nr:DUF4402 domain-containing protein [Bacteroidota bacterium]